MSNRPDSATNGPDKDEREWSWFGLPEGWRALWMLFSSLVVGFLAVDVLLRDETATGSFDWWMCIAVGFPSSALGLVMGAVGLVRSHREQDGYVES
jgi:hypothetical protein